MLLGSTRGFATFRGVLDFFGELPVDSTAVDRGSQGYWKNILFTLLTYNLRQHLAYSRTTNDAAILYVHVDSSRYT